VLAKEGKNPFKLDSKAPKIRFEDYAYMETRYKMLTKSHPDAAKKLMALAEMDVQHRWHVYEELAREPGGNGAKAEAKKEPAPSQN
jgi:pyruvate-ferredoxin/flavodoxin oxidoreductase